MKSPDRTRSYLCYILTADVFLVAALAAVWLVTTLPSIPGDLTSLGRQTGVDIYADSGELLYSFNRRVRRVSLDEVSPHFVNAVLATEDRDFHRHHGFSVKAIFGAFVDNVRHLRKVRGGSTITQQIVKNLFLSREKSYIRKLREILLAVQLETMFREEYGDDAKSRLLELYINGSFYGTNAYGVADAAWTYFGKTAQDLSPREAALLAGLPNAPGALSPYRDDRGASKRRTEHVLRRMRSVGDITEEELNDTLNQEVVLSSHRAPKNRTPYLVETVKAEVTRMWGRSALSFGGLKIRTTLDLKMQRVAEKAIAEGVADLDRRLGFRPYATAPDAARDDYVQAALICLDPATGYVKAMVGGRDIFVSYYNRATSARRQPGSGFKPILYLAAFESGEVTPVSLFVDEPRTYVMGQRRWSPKNYRNSYLGLTTAAWALTRSANSTSAQVVFRIGPEPVVKMARKLGIESPLAPYPSLALGTSEVTLLELASAYATVASYGIRTAPAFIRSIEDLNGTTIYRYQVRPAQVVEPATASVLLRLMENVVDRGTGRIVRRLGYTGPAAGKTGTTNDNTDAWFTGFTPDLVTGVWVGFDRKGGGRRLVEKRSRRQITGASGAAPIWTAFMKAVADTTGRFWLPDGVREVWVDPVSGVEVHPDSVADSTRAKPIRIALPRGLETNDLEDLAEIGLARIDTAAARR